MRDAHPGEEHLSKCHTRSPRGESLDGKCRKGYFKRALSRTWGGLVGNGARAVARGTRYAHSRALRAMADFKPVGECWGCRWMLGARFCGRLRDSPLDCKWIDAKRPWSACSEFHELPPFAVVLCERFWATVWCGSKRFWPDPFPKGFCGEQARLIGLHSSLRILNSSLQM